MQKAKKQGEGPPKVACSALGAADGCSIHASPGRWPAAVGLGML